MKLILLQLKSEHVNTFNNKSVYVIVLVLQSV